MKFTTFRGLIIGGALIGGIGVWAGSCAYCSRGIADPSPTAKTTATATSVPTVPEPGPTTTLDPSQKNEPAPAPVAGALRPMDRDVLARVAGPVPGGKVKDVWPGRPYKVSIYKDAGHAKANRVKIDLDRNGKWDEKWTLEDDGKIKRAVAPKDDEDYTLEYRLRGEGWAPKSTP